ncbi:MAG: hypothetical protein HOF23_01930, partial [Rhodospirillaceae bacterium]|nr:hypothetical protein [Rhodospirillaceae bacterium]
MIPRLSKFLSLSVVAAASIAVTSPTLASVDDLSGRWSGFFTAGKNADCRSNEWGIRAHIRNGKVTFSYSSRRGKVEINGEIEDDGEAKAHGLVGRNNDRQITVKGKFDGPQFDGIFYIEDNGCTGTVKVVKDGAAPIRRRPPPPHLAERGGLGPRGAQFQQRRAANQEKLRVERQAKEKAEAEAQAMQAKIARLQA